MRFSIRSLLAVMLICALAFPLVIAMQKVRVEESLRDQLLNEIKTQRQRLASDDPQLTSIRERQQEQRLVLHRIRRISQQRFDSIQSEYGSIESPDTHTLSLRSVPQLSLSDDQPPIVFRLHVPSDREVWLKYALIPFDLGSEPSRRLDRIRVAPKKSRYAHDGPFQWKLPAGEHLFKVTTGPPNGFALPIHLHLNTMGLLHTAYVSKGTPSSGFFHISGRKQIDFGPKRDLPWLLNVRIRVQKEDGSSVNPDHSPAIWLSDVSSGFDPFPDARPDDQGTR